MLLLGMVAVLALSTVACGGNGEGAEGEKVTISVAGWPTENEESYETMNAIKEKFEEAYPNVTIEPDTYKYQVQTFMTKASGNQLATLFQTPITETRNVIESGWAADITDAMQKRMWYQAMSPDLLEWMSDEEGSVYGIPNDMYALGLFVNKELFAEAGLVNDDGTVKAPQTYQELAEYAKIVKDKTGKAGYVIPTINNCGGWHFMNIAWSYGTEFMEEQSDGSWKATFDTQSTRDALQYVHDLRWKYNVLLDDTVIDQPAMEKYIGAGQGATGFMSVTTGSYVAVLYGLDKDKVSFVSMPGGPAGRISQMGGTINYISADATPEQIEAVLDWLDFNGKGPFLSEEALNSIEENCKNEVAEGRIVLDRVPFPIWSDESASEQINSIYAKYTNVDAKDYEDYFAFEGVTIKPEYANCCQELYATLDKCIQEVLTNEDADIAGLIKAANEEFQVNYLDKLTR